jgi:CRISPR-associated protein Csx14
MRENMLGPDSTHVLLATLGGQPQVVTFALDLLLQRNIPIQEVIVIHPVSHPGLQQAINHLNAEFIGDRYRTGEQTITIHFRQQVLRHYDEFIEDIIDEQTAEGTLNTIDELIRDLKQRQSAIHFLIAGGRRLMSFLSFSAALLNFDTTDRLWHIYTPQALQERARGGKIMHAAPEDGVRLIEVPFTRAASSILRRIVQDEVPNAGTAIRLVNEQTDAQERERCNQVIKAINPAPLKVLQAFAKGLYPQQVASELGISLATVSSHTNVLLRECRNAWNLPDNERLDYHFLQWKFATYFNDS